MSERQYAARVGLSRGAIQKAKAAGRLVLWGAEDLFVPIRHAQRFCARWTIPLVYEPGVGHWGLFERPDVFARHLAAHWVRGGRAPGEAAR